MWEAYISLSKFAIHTTIIHQKKKFILNPVQPILATIIDKNKYYFLGPLIEILWNKCSIIYVTVMFENLVGSHIAPWMWLKFSREFIEY